MLKLHCDLILDKVRNIIVHSRRLCSFNKVELSVTPKTSFIDEENSIIVEGLEPNSPFTISAHVESKINKFSFSSAGQYISSSTGSIDVEKNNSLGGTYTGIEKMGLFWSMEAQPGSITRLINEDVTKPLNYVFNVHKGHHNIFSLLEKPLTTATCCKKFLSDEIKKTEINQDGFVGTLFTPPEEKGPYPGIMFLFGGTFKGKVLQDVASVMANKGFVTFSLGFYSVSEKLPKTYANLDLKYFQNSLREFSNLKSVQSGGIGLYGISKGGDICLSMATKLNRVKAVVCHNCFTANTIQNLTFENVTVPGIKYNTGTSHQDGERTIHMALNHQVNPKDFPESQIEFEKSKAHFLFIASGDDHNINVVEQFDYAKERFDSVGNKNYEIIIYPGAGHIADMTHLPHCTMSPFAFMNKYNFLSNGGDKLLHHKAMQHCWKKIPDFFHKKLRVE